MEAALIASRTRVRRPTPPRPSILPLTDAVEKLVAQRDLEAVEEAGDQPQMLPVVLPLIVNEVIAPEDPIQVIK